MAMTFDGAVAGNGTGGLKSLVDTMATQYGIPPWIAENIVQLESGFNPNAVGDRGTSFGLLQLHRGGQAGNHSVSDLENPTKNLQIGLPYIARGYAAAKSQGYTGFALLEHTAGQSGHPGGSPGSYIMPSSYAAQLQRIYKNGGGSGSSALDLSGGTSSDGSGTPAKNPMTFDGGLSGFFSGIDNAMQIDFQWTSPIASLTNDAGAIAFRVALFILGLLIILIGLLMILKKV